MFMCSLLLCFWKRVFAMTSAFSWQNSISLCPASFCTPRPNVPITPGVSWFPTFAFQSPIMKKMSFSLLGLECKSKKSRNTWSNRQIWPWSTEWSRTKANRVLLRERTGHSTHHLPIIQEKTLHMDLTRCSTLKSDWLYSLQPKMEKLYTVSKNKTGSWLWPRSWTPYCKI